MRTSAVVEANPGGFTMLLHTGNWTYYEFDGIATSIWEFLEAPSDLDTIVNGLMLKYNVAREQCEQDTKRFLDDMIEQGIVVKG